MLNHISPEEAQTAARIAAQRFFSKDVATTVEDLASIAMVRILERDPHNIGTAVHVGREGIMRELSYRRYKNATETIALSVAFPAAISGGRRSPNDVCPITNEHTVEKQSLTEADQKYKRYVRKIARKLGQPIKRFGQFGIAYPADVESQIDIRIFDDPAKSTLRRKRLLKRGKIITKKLKQLAEFNFVFLLIG